MVVKGIVFFLTQFYFLLAFAAWEPEAYCRDQSKDLISLEEESYLKLKDRVFTALQNTWCSKEKAELMMDLVMLEKPKKIVEVGVFTGSSFLPLAAAVKHLNHGHLFGIDAWSNDVAVEGIDQRDPNYAWWKKVDMKSVKNQFQDLLNQWSLKRYCTIYDRSSREAVANFQDGEIDILHLDGSFSKEGFAEDVRLFFPKVKEGGLVIISNLLFVVMGEAPRFETYIDLWEECETISDVNDFSTIVLRKISQN